MREESNVVYSWDGGGRKLEAIGDGELPAWMLVEGTHILLMTDSWREVEVFGQGWMHGVGGGTNAAMATIRTILLMFSAFIMGAIMW